MGGLRVGKGYDADSQCGPLINAEAVEHMKALVADAKTGGAEVLVGGTIGQGDGYFYLPTVLGGVPARARIMNEESFGPIAPIAVFDSEDEVITSANHTEYGLIAYVYTRDLARGMRVAERLESGMIGLNRGLVSDPAAPFGGVKQSGLGREGSHHGIMEFVETKYIATSWDS